MKTARNRPTRRARCSNCGDEFVSVKSLQGRWSRTCSLVCRLAALDRMISAFEQRRAELADRIEKGAR